jgi:hypothetical protein
MQSSDMRSKTASAVVLEELKDIGGTTEEAL